MVDELLESGREVRVLDVLLHGQDDVAARARAPRRRGHPRRRPRRRRARERRSTASTRWCTSPRSSAIPPARATRSSRTTSTSRAAARLVADARELGVERFVFASTCSNYGRMADPDGPDRRGRRAAARVALRRAEGRDRAGACSSGEHATRCTRPACASRPSTASAPRMRFDLTVNEFTRDLWADRDLEVFGEQFWRPYVHVARRRARGAHGARRARREGRPARSSTSATPTRTTASSTSSR